MQHDNNNLWVTLLVLGMGAYYASLSTTQPSENFDVSQLSRDILSVIEKQFLGILNSADVEAVQICVLLGSYYLFNGRPTAGLGVLGSGIKIGQALRLHREVPSVGLSEARLEARRRCWWALEVFDKSVCASRFFNVFPNIENIVRYAAIAFGRPCSIDDADCDVKSVSNVKTEIAMAPRQAAQLDYHISKFKLYRIMGPFLGRRLQKNRLESLSSIHAQLTLWESQLPQYLRLKSYTTQDTPKAPSLLQMQALALQLTYDNIQIVLHRGLAFGSGPNISHTHSSLHDLPGAAFSREQLFRSALRTSDLNEYRDLLHACRRTHAAMHLGICLFTAGVVLCALAISEPLSTTSEAAKKGVMNILRFQHDHVLHEHLLSVQSVRILEDLVTVLMRTEQRFIRGDRIPRSPSLQINFDDDMQIGGLVSQENTSGDFRFTDMPPQGIAQSSSEQLQGIFSSTLYRDVSHRCDLPY